MYKTRVQTWIESVKQKIAYLGTKGISSEDSMLAIKEIEGLFGLINQATSNYNKSYIKDYDKKIKDEQDKLNKLQGQLEIATLADSDEVPAIEAQIKNTEKIISEYKKQRANIYK
jgi:hypothetical protein